MTESSIAGGHLKLPACVMLLVGAMIGSAIFSLSGLTILSAGPAAVLSWFLAGIIMLLYGSCMGELACRFPRSGGVYVFPRLAFGGRAGRWLGWISCWCFILTNIVAVAFSAIYVGVYLGVSFPAAAGLPRFFAAGSILICLGMNLCRMELTGRINAVIVLVLLGTMGIYAGSALSSPAYSPAMLVPFFHQGCGGPAGFLTAVPVAVIGYSGIVALAFMVSEVCDAQRTVPLAMTIAIVLVILVYVIMITATLGLISASYLEAHPDMRFIPMFSACFTRLQSQTYLRCVVSIAAVLALMTTMLVCISMNARAVQAAGKAGILPAFFGKTSRNGVPAAAVWASGIPAMIYGCFPEYTMTIVNFGAVFNVITMTLTMLALIRSRRNADRSGFTAPGGKVLPWGVLAVLLMCNAAGILSGGRMLWVYTVFFLAAGCGVLLIPPRWKQW